MKQINLGVAESSMENTEERVELGTLLREAREYLGLSQGEVVKYLNIPRSALSHIESGRRRIDALELKKLSELYKKPISFFTGGDEYQEGIPEDVAHLARAAKGLSDGDREELSRFAEYLQVRAKTQNQSDD